MLSKLLVVSSISIFVIIFVIGGSALACIDDSGCADGNICTQDICIDGVCSNPPHINGTPCPDNDFCNGAETCQGGVCYPGYPVLVDDGNPCTLDYCDPIVGGVNEIRPDGASCSDEEPTNGDEICLGGVCTAGTAPPVPTVSEHGELLLVGLLALGMGWALRRQTAAG
jgi:MYXO-CTERM domain-containing protein